MPQVHVYVTLKPTLLDAQGRAVQDALHALGYPDVEDVRIGKFIVLSLRDESDVEQKVADMCNRLLANPVIEDYRFEVVK
jgi:phosphoribosylformylglycinamidine synthase